jgi:Tfp pilus assembly protein PilP
MTSKHALALAGLLIGLLGPGCGEGDAPVTGSRGMTNSNVKIDAKPPPPDPGKAPVAPAGGGSRRSGTTGEAPAEDQEPEPVRPDRPRAVISREDFSAGARDPFHTYVSPILDDQPAPVEVLDKQRNVKLSEYDFEQLKLIAIVNAGRNVEPRALFVASSDQKSKTVRQGEYFSSAEVLLASVNRDYIEIEIMDPELTPGWNMERGERRVIYLKDPGKQQR